MSGNPGAAAIEGPLRALEQRVWLLELERDWLQRSFTTACDRVDDEITEANRALNDMLDARRAMYSADGIGRKR